MNVYESLIKLQDKSAIMVFNRMPEWSIIII